MIIPKQTNPNYEHFKQKAHKLLDELNPNFPWKITAVRHRKKRSNPQNAYHWGVIITMICEDTGNDKNDIHEYLLGEYAGWEEYEVLGKRKVRPARRSADMNTEEFNDFNEWCSAWAAKNLGMVIPMPGETIL